MNVSLLGMVSATRLHGAPLGNVETLLDQIHATADELARHDDTRPIGPPILIPEGVEYPGSYRVCFPVAMEGHATYFVYVNADGEAQRFKMTLEGYRR